MYSASCQPGRGKYFPSKCRARHGYLPNPVWLARPESYNEIGYDYVTKGELRLPQPDDREVGQL